MNKNISSLHNEFIAHRISLIPICMYKSDENIKIILELTSISWIKKNISEKAFFLVLYSIHFTKI